LKTFENDIDLNSLESVDMRPDGVVVMHCNNLYEYSRFGFQEEQEQSERIEKYKDIFIGFSSLESVQAAIKQVDEISEADRDWILDKLNAEGSAVPVTFTKGKRGNDE